MEEDQRDYLISIVVPVYNVEKYLETCVNSLIHQSYSNLEIILVDDGSTDSSGKLCDILASRDSRISVIHKKNAGLGMARNTGLQNANGEYISFIDSDDYIKIDTYEKIVNLISKSTIDAVYFGHIKVNDTRAYCAGSLPSELEYCGEEILRKFFLNSLGELPRQNGNDFTGISACCAVYRKELLDTKSILFQSERKVLSEDIIFNLNVCANANCIKILPEYLYYYVFRGSSLTKTYRGDRFEASKKMYEVLNEEFKKYGVAPNDYRVKLYFLVNLIVCLKQEVMFSKANTHKFALKRIKEICNDELVQSVLCEFPLQKLSLSLKIWFIFVLKKQVFMLYSLTWLQLFKTRR